VTLPNSWEVVDFIHYFLGGLSSVDVYLDGNYYCKAHKTGQIYSVELNQTPPGQHSLNITVQYHTYYKGPAFDGTHVVSDIFSTSGPVYQYPRVVSDVVYFTVEQPAQNPSPTPIDSSSLDQTFYAATVIVAVIVIASVSFVYVRKTKLTFFKKP